MTKIIAITIVGLLLVSSMSVLIAASSVTPGTGIDLEKIGKNKDPTGWYSSWYRDTNRDGIEDQLLLGQEKDLDIFVDLMDRPTDKELKRFEDFGPVTYVDPYIGLVALSGVDRDDLKQVSELPKVVMLEEQPVLVPMLNVSLPAIRGVSSTMYSHGAQDLGYNGSGVTVAVFDTGVDNDVHDFLDDLDDDPATNDDKFLAGVDTTPIIGYIETDPEDIDGHGTHVAAIAIGTGGSAKTHVGVAPQSNLVDVKVLPTFGSGNAVDFLEGLTWCRNNMDTYNIRVLSMSLGTQGMSDGNDSLSRAVDDAVTRDGLIVIAAMGNDGPNNDGVPAPAAADEAIAVGAYDDFETLTRADDSIWSGSNRGPRLSDGDSDKMDELKPDVSAPGVDIWSAQANTIEGLRRYTGTSQATPHVSGTVALMLQADPDLTSSGVRKILRDTAQSRGPAYDTDLSPKYNTGYGWGMLDAYGAVKRAEDLYNGGTIVGPPTVSGGSSGTFTAKFDLTRTDFESTSLNASMIISIPRSWGKPSSIAITSTGGVAYTSGHSEPVQDLSNWTFSAWAEYSGVVSTPTTLEPTVTFKTFAPIDLQTYKFYMEPSLNGISGTEHDFDVQVSEGTGGEPDFYLTADDISFSSDQPVSGQFVSIEAVIHNEGTLGANANISFFDGPPQTGLLIGIDTVSVPSGGLDTASTIWIATPGTHQINVAIDLFDSVEETNEDNNQANKSITVTGLNNPPTASLTVTPSNVGIGSITHFDGSNSTDLDGIIVLYNFDFGDGNTSGWLPSPNVTYSYKRDGLFITSLTVQDNGGAQSTNDPQVLVNVHSTTTKTRTMFVHDAYRLLFTQPDASKPSTVPLPNGFTPITPGSPFGTVEEKDIGTWNSNTFKKNNTIGGSIDYHIWINNTGTTDIEVTNFTFILLHEDYVIDRAVATSPNIIQPGIRVEVIAHSSLQDRVISVDQIISLDLQCAIDGDSGVLEFASMSEDSGVDISFTSFQGIPPIVDAGENLTARLNETVDFIPSASDEDGKIEKYEWDFETDGNWDYVSSSTGVTNYEYQAVGTYNATIRVTDNEGDTATDTVMVTIRPKNRAPQIKNPDPPGSISMEAGTTRTFSVDISDPDGDPIVLKWFIDGHKQIEEGTSFIYQPLDMDVGSHKIKVTASDGEDSASHIWTVVVEAVNHAPQIVSSNPKGGYISIDEGGSRLFSVDAEDEDGDDLTFRWTVDGILVGSDKSHLYFADQDSIGVHELKFVASDGELDVSEDWTVEIISLNNPPSIRYTIPSDGDTFKTTDVIRFEVEARDSDGDVLKYTWTSNIDGQIGNKQTASTSLSNGTHTITIKVEDGRGGVDSKIFVITVNKVSKSAEEVDYGMGALVFLLIVVVIIMFLFMIRKRQHPGSMAQHGTAYYDDYEDEDHQVIRARPKKTTRPKHKSRRRKSRPTRSLEDRAMEDEREDLEDIFNYDHQPVEEVEEVIEPKVNIPKKRLRMERSRPGSRPRSKMMKHAYVEEEEELEDIYNFEDEHDDEFLDDDGYEMAPVVKRPRPAPKRVKKVKIGPKKPVIKRVPKKKVRKRPKKKVRKRPKKKVRKRVRRRS